MYIKQAIVTLGLALTIAPAFANIQMTKLAATACPSLAGKWEGDGNVSATVFGFPIRCRYHGTAKVSYPDNQSSEFIMDVVLTKKDGPCPDNEPYTLSGTCSDGNVKVWTDKAKLHGTINSTPTAADLEGTVTVSVLDKDVDADVRDMHLTKQ
jgi:hypothetical protein